MHIGTQPGFELSRETIHEDGNFQHQYVLGHHKESRETLTFNLIPHLPFPTGCQRCQHAPPLELIWGMPSHMEAETSVREPQRS
ncbi:hypothetical protein SRHO_G00168220 [Serrasalmus rhombeus]